MPNPKNGLDQRCRQRRGEVAMEELHLVHEGIDYE